MPSIRASGRMKRETAMTKWNRHARNCAILTLLCALSMPFSSTAPFISDDTMIIAGNAQYSPHLSDIGQSCFRRTTGTKSTWAHACVPAASRGFILPDLRGGRPQSNFYHLASFLLHIAVTLLISPTRKEGVAGRPRRAADGAGVIRRSHRSHLEAVLWARNQAELLAALFARAGVPRLRAGAPTPRASVGHGRLGPPALRAVCARAIVQGVRAGAAGNPGPLCPVHGGQRQKMRKALALAMRYMECAPESRPLSRAGLHSRYVALCRALARVSVQVRPPPCTGMLSFCGRHCRKTYAFYHWLLLVPATCSFPPV